MTTLDVNLEHISARAVQIKPMRVLLWLIAAPFIVIGVVFRVLWLAPAFLIASAVDGWQAADKAIKQMQAQARERGRVGG